MQAIIKNLMIHISQSGPNIEVITRKYLKHNNDNSITTKQSSHRSTRNI